MGASGGTRLVQVQTPSDHAQGRGGARGRNGDDLLSYLFTAFLSTSEPPPADEARAYLLEGALFDERPEIIVAVTPSGSFERMELRYDRARSPLMLRRLSGEDAEAARAEAIDVAAANRADEIEAALTQSRVVLEWEVQRSELDEDAWFALHLWQAWLLRRSGGWLYAPCEGIFDAELKLRCAAGGPSRVTDADR